MSAGKKQLIKPLYLFYQPTFDANVESIRKAFSDHRLDNLLLGYSVKTNPHPVVLDAAKHLSMYAEIVSPHELNVATSCGFSLSNIIYNGVIPDPTDKFNVAKSGGIVNLESYLEFQQIESMARSKGIPVQVGIRLNVNIGNGRTSRFGLEHQSDEYQKVMELTKCSEYISIAGVHSHVYGGRQTKFWKNRVIAVAKIAYELGAGYIDLGSNMFGPMDPRMAEQFDDEIPTFDDYAATVKDALDTIYSGKPPMLILEPGTPVVSNAVSVLAEVLNIRRVCGKNIATANCTEYDFGFTPATKNVPVDVIHNSEGIEYNDLDIYGYTCTEGDVLHRSYNGRLAIGDFLLFRNLGAYSVSLSNSFIQEPMSLVLFEFDSFRKV